MKESSLHRSVSPHLVVLVCDKPSARVAKVGYGLKHLGCRVTLLHRETLPTDNHTISFDEVHLYRSPEDALNLAQLFKPIVFHIFSSWDFDTAAAFIKHKPGRIVFDDYDVLSGVTRPDFIAANYPAILATEKYCLENADAITCRDLKLQSAKRNLHYKISDRLLYLPDCCWADSSGDSSPDRGIDVDSLHLVVAGNMAIEKFAASAHLRDNYYFLDFAKDITGAGIHFHLYPSPSFSGDFENVLSDHLELAAHNAFFHVHRPLPADLLVTEISNYDLGLLSMWQEIQCTNKAYLPVMYRDATSNKLFDYLDAGLGIVTCDAFKFQRWFLRKENICTSAYLEEVKDTLLAQPLSYWRGLRNRVRQARNRFSVKMHAQRLLSFYETLGSVNRESPQARAGQGEHLALAQQAYRRGAISQAIRETELELYHFPGQPEPRHFLSFLQLYSRKVDGLDRCPQIKQGFSL